MNLGQTLGPTTFQSPSNPIIGNTAAVVASADSITITSELTRITGTTTINTITVGIPYFIGPIYLFNTDASVGATGTSGNIALATTLTRYHLFTLMYDAAASKWYASATS